MIPRPRASSAQQAAFLFVTVPLRRPTAPQRLSAMLICSSSGGRHPFYSTVLLNGRRRPAAAAGTGAGMARSAPPAWGLLLKGSTAVQWQQQRRGLASSSSSGEERGVLIYRGGHGSVIRTLKRVSLTTCAIGLASTPFFLALGSEAVPMAANAALTGVVLLATCGPTVLLHAFTKPYIFSLRSLPPAAAGEGGDGNDAKAKAKPASSPNTTPNSSNGDQLFRAETMSFTTRRAYSEFALSDVEPLPNSTRPFVTFQARGRLYFVHGETFADKALLAKLLGRPLKEAEAVPVEPPFEDEEED